jgi:hypothetical protein
LEKYDQHHNSFIQGMLMDLQQPHTIAPQLAANDGGENGSSAMSIPAKIPYILVVTRNGHMAEAVMDYAVNVADRLNYSILAVYIDTLPFYLDGGKRSRFFASAMQESSSLFRHKAATRGVLIEHLGESGKIGKVVKRLCRSDKRVEFVVVDQGVRLEEVVSQSPVPVFTVRYTQNKAGLIPKADHYKPTQEGVTRMSSASRKRHVQNCFVFGALTAGIYAAVFTHQELVMTYLTKGGLYALLPVALVFSVSYTHGNFTSSFWSALGIEGSKVTATKKADIRQDTTDSIRKDTRPRMEMSV